LREVVASGFGRWGAFVARHPWPVLIVALTVCGAFASRLPHVELDTTVEAFLHADDPTLVAYDDFRARFGRDDPIIIGIETPAPFSREFLERLRAFHDDVEASVPHLDDVTSMLNARWTRGRDDELLVRDLVENLPETEADIVALRERVAANPLYLNTLISADGRLTTMEVVLDSYVQDGVDDDGAPVLRHLTSEENSEVMTSLVEVLDRHRGDEFALHTAGLTFMADRLAFRLIDDVRSHVRLAVLLSAATLFVMFGRIKPVVLTLLVAGLSVACTIALLPLLSLPYQPPTQLVPASLFAIGIGDSVHILAIYYQRRERGDDRSAALATAFAHSGAAILMTSVTTAAAMMSFLTAEIAPIARIGLLMPAGVMIAFALTSTLLPALVVLLPERPRSIRTRRSLLDRVVIGAGIRAARTPWLTVMVAAVVLLAAVVGAARVRFSHDPVRWFPPGDSFRVSSELLNERLGGIVAAEILFETGEKDAVLDPRLLAGLERITRYNDELGPSGPGLAPADARAGLHVAKTISVVDLLKEINRALNENRASHYVLPDSRELVSQELLLFELSGSDDLEDFVDYEYTTARMTVRVPWIDAVGYGDFLDRLTARYREIVGDDAELIVTGRLPVLTRTFTAVIHSMARSYLFAFVAITPLMILILGRPGLGLLAMIPNLFPVVAALGLMGWLGWPLDAFSLLTGSIVLGLAVDDTIHFMYGFHNEYARSGDAVQAVRETLATTGQALFFTTVILCAGFGVYLGGYMRNLSTFASITVLSLLVAFLADIALAPALVVLASRRARGRRGESAR